MNEKLITLNDQIKEQPKKVYSVESTIELVKKCKKTIDNVVVLRNKIEKINTERDAFIQKYVNNPWLRAAVRVLGIGLIVLGVVTIHQTIVISNAWLSKPYGGGYTNLEALIFYTFFTFGIALIAALAVVSAPIVAGALSIGYGGYNVIFPEKMLLNFAPKKAHLEEANLKENLSFLKNELHIDDDQIEELIALLKKDELTEDKIIEKVQLFQDKIAEFQQVHQEVALVVDP